MVSSTNPVYRGRLAPTPTGYLHAGHALTFATAAARARAQGGELLLRVEDLDRARCRPEYVAAALEDLRWLGLAWTGEPLFQSTRRACYRAAWERLRDGGFIYPCARSRRDVESAPQAPHGEEPVFPAAWRTPAAEGKRWADPAGTTWRFQVPDGERIVFDDARLGPVARTAGSDFGDFVIWNRDDIPAYELAVVVDDAATGITEAVRGADLLASTCRQLLVYRALGLTPPAFYHGPLVADAAGRRLAKRDAATTLRALRAAGWTPAEVVAEARTRLMRE